MEAQSYINFLFSIMALSVFIINTLIRLYFLEEAICLKITGFSRLAINLFEFLIFLFKMI